MDASSPLRALPRDADSPAPEPGADADLALARAVIGGDLRASERFFRDHVDDLYAFVHYRAGTDPHGVEDLVQDVFLTALDRLEVYDGRVRLAGWLRGIAKNKLHAFRRRRRPSNLGDLLEDADGEIDAILARVQKEPLPEHVLSAKETRELVGAALSSLPTDYSTALSAKYLEDRSVAEIGERLGRTTKATESLLTRARTAFGEVLELLAKRRGGRP